MSTSWIQERTLSADAAASYIRNGMTVAMSGYTSSGYPKSITEALENRRAAGETLGIDLISGSALGEVDERLSDIIIRRVPLQESKALAARINKGETHYAEQQIGKIVRLLESGKLGKIDVAVIEVADIKEDGELLLGPSIGISPLLISLVDHIIIERNHGIPACISSLHDIFMPGSPPHRTVIPFERIAERIGKGSVKVPIEKVIGIVECNNPPEPVIMRAPTQVHRQITEHLMTFLRSEYPIGQGKTLPPIQTGFGQIAMAITDALSCSEYNDLKLFSGTLNERHMEMIAAGKVTEATATYMQFTPRTKELFETVKDLEKKLVLRNLEVINCAETTSRFGILALNSCIELDIYGNVNSSHIGGTRVVNGIGGGANFAQNAGLSVMLVPSVGKDGAISTIVPMVSHVDINEHDIDVVVTEHGYADLRGLDDMERANTIIQYCASPMYRDQLQAYLMNAKKKSGGHHPQDMVAAGLWYEQLKQTGTMLA